MDQFEAVRRALLEEGTTTLSKEDLAEYVRRRYGVTIRPALIPILKATLKDKENLATWKRHSLAAAPAAVSLVSPAMSQLS